MNLKNFIQTYHQLKSHWNNFSANQIHQYQEEKVIELVKFAMENSVFYKNLYKGKEIKTLEDFKKLPTINKQIMMTNFDTLNTVGITLEDAMKEALRREIQKDYLGYYQNKFVLGLSSGTSGNKGLYLTPKELTQLVPSVFLARGGVGFSDLPARIMFVLRVFSQGFQDINAPLIHLQYMPSMTPPQEMIETLKKQKTNILMIPPSVLRLWLPWAHLVPPLKKIITYAEVLEKEEKKRFEEIFRTHVYEIYQASEGQIASPCSEGHLHINEDLVYIELLDAEGKEVTQPQQIASTMLVTNLVNRAQPLIRYQMNDLLQLGDPCSCGSNFRPIDHVIGRHDDVMHFTDQNGQGRAVFPDLMSRWIITTSDEIREFIVTQTGASELHIRIDIMGNDKEKVMNSLYQRLKIELAFYKIEVEITIEEGTIILPTDNRKLKRFLNQISH